MKLLFAALKLYAKAGAFLTLPVAFVLITFACLFPQFLDRYRIVFYLTVVLYSLVLAFWFRPVDSLLISLGVPHRKRLAIMLTAWLVHLGALWLLLCVAGIFSLVYHAHPDRRADVVAAIYAAPLNYIPLNFGILTLALVIGWVDYQSRRLAGMRPVDSALFFLLGQACVVLFLITLSGFTPIVFPFPGLLGQYALPLAGACLAAVFALTRLIAATRHLSDSELT